MAQTSPDRKLGEDNEEKVLGRLGITYGVLRRLGFAEERVEECLRAISGTELEEAFDWVCDVSIAPLQHRIHHYVASPSLHRRGNRSELVCVHALLFGIRDLPVFIRFRRSGRARNTKIIQDFAAHVHCGIYSITDPPDTSHSGPPATLPLPSFDENFALAHTLTIGCECSCLHPFICARTIAASRGSAGRKTGCSGT